MPLESEGSVRHGARRGPLPPPLTHTSVAIDLAFLAGRPHLETMPLCPDCGAAVADDGTCRAMFDELLAHEYMFPTAFGVVHHLTVSAYYLQHPRGYSRDAIRTWREIIADSLDGVATPRTFLQRARAQSSRPVHVREPGAEPPDGWPRTWPMTVADVIVPPGETPDAAGHIERVRRWAASIRTTLDEVVSR